MSRSYFRLEKETHSTDIHLEAGRVGFQARRLCVLEGPQEQPSRHGNAPDRFWSRHSVDEGVRG